MAAKSLDEVSSGAASGGAGGRALPQRPTSGGASRRGLASPREINLSRSSDLGRSSAPGTCRKGAQCRLLGCKSGRHPSDRQSRPCADPSGCQKFDCDYLHARSRLGACRNEGHCFRFAVLRNCNFLPPPQKLCPLNAECRVLDCYDKHDAGRPAKCSKDDNCENIACDLLHLRRRKGACRTEKDYGRCDNRWCKYLHGGVTPHCDQHSDSQPCLHVGCRFDHAAADLPANCTEGETCRNVACRLRHPRDRPAVCRRKDTCRSPLCPLLHTDVLTECRFSNCVFINCRFVHRDTRPDHCREGTACRKFSCHLLHPDDRPAPCSGNADCDNATCRYLHPHLSDEVVDKVVDKCVDIVTKNDGSISAFDLNVKYAEFVIDTEAGASSERLPPLVRVVGPAGETLATQLKEKGVEFYVNDRGAFPLNCYRLVGSGDAVPRRVLSATVCTAYDRLVQAIHGDGSLHKEKGLQSSYRLFRPSVGELVRRGPFAPARGGPETNPALMFILRAGIIQGIVEWESFITKVKRELLEAMAQRAVECATGTGLDPSKALGIAIQRWPGLARIVRDRMGGVDANTTGKLLDQSKAAAAAGGVDANTAGKLLDQSKAAGVHMLRLLLKFEDSEATVDEWRRCVDEHACDVTRTSPEHDIEKIHAAVEKLLPSVNEAEFDSLSLVTKPAADFTAAANYYLHLQATDVEGVGWHYRLADGSDVVVKFSDTFGVNRVMQLFYALRCICGHGDATETLVTGAASVFTAERKAGRRAFEAAHVGNNDEVAADLSELFESMCRHKRFIPVDYRHVLNVFRFVRDTARLVKHAFSIAAFEVSELRIWGHNGDALPDFPPPDLETESD